ncbi:MAG TPA: YbjN domain-containing protein [Bauldia sp.]|nr:YbjN domain-containing protein [Bauldia sp.]
MGIWATPVRTAGLFLASSLTIGALSDLAWGAGQQGGQNASNAPSIITGHDVSAIADELYYYDAEPDITTDNDGYPMIRVNDSQTPFQIFFHKCNHDTKQCDVIEFSAHWDLKNGIQSAVIDKWNQTKLWGVAYRDKQNDPNLSLTVELGDGVTTDNFDDIVDDWDNAMNDFITTIGWKKK